SGHGGAVADQAERRLGQRARHRPRHGEDIEAQVDGMFGGDPRTALGRPLDHDHPPTQRSDQTVPRREAERLGLGPWWILAEERYRRLDPLDQIPIDGWL